MRTLLLIAIALIALTNVSLAEEYRMVAPARDPGSSGIIATFINDSGSYLLAGQTGVAIFQQDGKSYFSQLKLVGSSSLALGLDFDQGAVYRDTVSKFFLFISTQPIQYSYGRVYRLYYSYDGFGYTRILTNSGTKKYELDDASRAQVAQITNGPNSTTTPGPGQNTTTPPQGSVTVSEVKDPLFGTTLGYKVELDHAAVTQLQSSQVLFEQIAGLAQAPPQVIAAIVAFEATIVLVDKTNNNGAIVTYTILGNATVVTPRP